jgi:hypothetical protein
MAVIATSLKCNEETDEIGSDDVYSVAWSAADPSVVWTTLASTVDPALGLSAWSNFDKGEERVGHRLLYPTLGAVGGDVQIAIMERDVNHDFHATSAGTKALETLLQAILPSVPQAARAAVMPMWFAFGVAKFRSNDEIIGFTSIGHSNNPATKEVTLTGDGGKYKLKFKSKI